MTQNKPDGIKFALNDDDLSFLKGDETVIKKE
jgi:hypothetical protein